MDKQEIKQLVRDIIAESAPDKEIKDGDSFFTAGISSIEIMQVQVKLAKQFKIKLGFRELSKYCSIEMLSDYISEKLG